MRIQFIESPTGSPFYLAYSVGTFADLSDNLAANLIEKRLAVKVEPENRTSKAKATKKRATVQSNNATSKRTTAKGRGEKPS